MKRKRTWIGIGLAALAVCGLLLAAVRPASFPARLLRALEQQVGRPVRAERVEVNWLPRPALRLFDLSIAQPEGFGDAPFLHAEEASCDIQLKPLFRGRAECARLHLLGANLHVVRNAQGIWNLGFWGQPRSRAWPRISAEAARIQFTHGVLTQPYALENTRLALEPQTGAWQVSLEGQPVRVDRELEAGGFLRLDGTVRADLVPPGLPMIDLRWEIGRSQLSDWLAFAAGRELALRATIALNGRLEGSAQKINLTGEFSLNDVRRPGLAPPRAVPHWRGQFDAVISPSEQRLEIARAELRSQQSVLRVRGRLASLFAQPRWEVEIDGPALALDELFAHYAAFKENVSPKTRLEGTAQLVAKVAGPAARAQATLRIGPGARWTLPGVEGAAEVEPFEVSWQGRRAELGRLALVFPQNRRLELSAQLLRRADAWWLAVAGNSPELDLNYLVAAARALGWSLWGETRWNGTARVALEWRGTVSAWAERQRYGTVELTNVSFRPPELTRPVLVETARVEYEGQAVRVEPLTVRIGETTAHGTLERARRELPWNLALAFDRFSLEQLHDLLTRESLKGLFGSWLDSSGRSRAPLEKVEAGGHLTIAEASFGPFQLSELEGELEWKPRKLRLAQLRFRSLGGQFRGGLEADFSASPPVYRLAGNWKQVDLNALLRTGTELGELFFGTLGADFVLRTQGGNPAELEQNLQGSVAAVVTNAVLARFNLLGAMRAAAGLEPEETDAVARTAAQSLAGEFRVAGRRVRFEGARMVVDSTALELSGEVEFDGRLNVNLRGESLLVAGVEPSPARRQLFAPSFTLRGTLRKPTLRTVPARRWR